MEYFGFITGLLYLYWEIRQNNLMWVVGILSALAYAVVFAQSGLYAAMMFQIYYFIVSIYGIICWHKDKKAMQDTSSAAPITYRIISLKNTAFSVVACAVIFAILHWLLERFTGDPMPVMDSIVTTLGIVATYWLGKSYLHQWLLWVVVNILSVYMFISQELYLTAALYILYTVCAFYGFLHWKKKGVKISV